LDYISIAKASGFNVFNNTITSLKDFELGVKSSRGLNFMCVKCDVDNETPRPPLSVVKTNEFR